MSTLYFTIAKFEGVAIGFSAISIAFCIPGPADEGASIGNRNILLLGNSLRLINQAIAALTDIYP